MPDDDPNLSVPPADVLAELGVFALAKNHELVGVKLVIPLDGLGTELLKRLTVQQAQDLYRKLGAVLSTYGCTEQ